MKLETGGLLKVFPSPIFSGGRPFFALKTGAFSAGPGITRVEGPNGAGKTTLLKVLAGVLEADGGRISLDGLAADAEALRAAAAFCPANPRSFYFRLSALENLRFFGALAGLDAGTALARGRELGARLGLPAADLEKRFDRLSEGGMQKVNLLRALSRRAPLLLLDEPYRGLDAAASAELTALLTGASAGVTVLIAGHALPQLPGAAALRLEAGELKGTAA